ncbi:MAG: hypothetical protein WD851_17325 [Pirellulales bacterium]
MVNDDDLVVKRRPEAGILPAVDPDVRPYRVAPRNRLPPLAKGRSIQRHATTDDGHQPAARLQSQKGLLYVPRPELGSVSVHAAAGRREGRIHDDGVVALFGRQKIVEPFGVERRRLEALEFQKCPPTKVDFIRVHLCAREPCQEGDVAGAGAWFKYDHVTAQRGRFDCYQRLSRRRAELLKVELMLVAPRLNGKACLLRVQLLDCGGGVGHIEVDFLEIDVESGLDGIIGVTRIAGSTSEFLAGQY